MTSPKPTPVSNKQLINLSIAENRVSRSQLVSKMNGLYASLVFREDMVYYQPTSGTEACKQSFLNLFKRTMSSRYEYRSNSLTLSSGCNASLEVLVSTIADAGDTIIVNTPGYATFDFDLGSRIGNRIARCDPVYDSACDYSDASVYYPTVARLEEEYDAQRAVTGKPPAALLITNPSNPLGINLPSSLIKDMIEWCERKGMHYISDEIYAGSCYNESSEDNEGSTRFASVFDVYADTTLPEHVSVVYSLSKDLSLSGLRAGCVYTENVEINESMQKVNDLCQISSHTQQLIEGMLGDDAWLEEFLEGNNARIRERYDRLVEVLEEVGIHFVRPDAGLFVWIDLRKFMGDGGEGRLYFDLMEQHGLCFTPGSSQGEGLDGFFRVVFTACDDGEFEEVLARLRGLINNE
jgi:aspartate/methionine/tyrosine aminotransferase